MEKKIAYTKAEMFAAIAYWFNGIDATNLTDTISTTDVVEFCHKEFEKIEARKEKDAVRRAERKAAADDLVGLLLNDILTNEFQTVAEIVDAIDDPEVTRQKVIYRLNALAKDGDIRKEDVTIPGGDGVKSRKLKGYALNITE